MSLWTPPPRPRWVERLNAHGDAVGGAHHLVSLDPDVLIATARASCGLEDFGGDEWEAPYRLFVESLENEAALHLTGRLITRSEILRTLRNRLQLADLWKRRPEILEAPLLPPAFIVGAPRSGTSILLELLALDPATRSPALWEMHHPVEALEGDALRPIGDQLTQFWHDVQPEYETMHANSGDLPNECLYISVHAFLSDHWGGNHHVPSYSEFLARADQRPAYRYHARFLRTLQQRQGGERWLLKAPSHLFQLRALFDVYPEARILRTHRDPLKTIPSTLSLMATLLWMRGDIADPVGTAELTTAGYAAVFAQEIARRADGRLPDDQFIDVQYAQLLDDPVGAIEAVYAQAEWRFPSGLADDIRGYLDARPRGAHGAHRYSLEGMGLDPEKERARFADYCAHYGVAEEA
ncbi:MAG: sulfotransferase [Myxococcota bacterium]